MGSGKRSRKAMDDDSDLEEFDDLENDNLMMEEEEEEEEEESEDVENESEEEVSHGMEDESEEDGIMQNDNGKDAEIEDLEKDYQNLRSQEQDILKNLKRHKHEDVLKGQAVKNQKTLWDKTLELRFLLQKPFSNSNKLPQATIRSSFCDSNEGVNAAYSDLITSSKKTLDSLLKLQEALLEKNPAISQSSHDGNSTKLSKNSKSSNVESDEEWSQISEMHKRIAAFRDKSIDKWQRKAQVTTGAAAIKSKLQAFNQNISEQVASYMRDPSRITKQMQLSRSAVGVFGTGLEEVGNSNKEDATADGDPELVDDSEFYQQLLKEFFETVDPASSEVAFYALKKMRTKKRKIVDRRASKSRKIRYNVHEKIVNFMAPRPANIPPMAPKLFSSLFGLKTQQLAPAV